jgi:hypothetical protein
VQQGSVPVSIAINSDIAGVHGCSYSPMEGSLILSGFWLHVVVSGAAMAPSLLRRVVPRIAIFILIDGLDHQHQVQRNTKEKIKQ